MKPRDIGNGRTIVTRTENFVNWCAWRFWLHRECSRTVFLEKLVVWGEWPPESLALAQIVAQYIKAARDKIGYGLPVCDPAQPWDRWSYAEREDYERRHREDFWWNPDLPTPRGLQKPGAYKTPLETELDEWVIAEAANYPPMKRGDPLPVIRSRFRKKERWEVPPAEREPMPYVESTPEQIAALKDAIARRDQAYGIKPNDDPRN